MGRKSKALDPGAGPVAAFAHELRKIRAKSGRTFDTMEANCLRGKGALAAAARGDAFPTWDTVEQFLIGCDAPDQADRIRELWQQTRAEIGAADEPNPESSDTVRDVVSPSATARAAAAVLGWVRRAPEWQLTGLVTVLLIIVATPWVMAAAGPRFERLSIDPLPDGSQAGAVATACDPQLIWRHQFPDDYAGEVYALMVDPSGPRPVDIELRWGGRQWTGTVTAHAGAPERAHGGTLIRFQKGAPTASPRTHLVASHPVCVAFGDAEGPTTRPADVVETPGWT